MLTGEDITINAGLTKTQKIPQGQHKLLLNVVVQLRPDESPATKQDPYVAMMEQFKQKQKVRNEPSDVQSNNDGPTTQAVPTATPATSEASQWSWMDPQIHLKSASGKVQSTHHDITDFVNVAGGGSVEQVISECGGARVLVKSGPPNLSLRIYPRPSGHSLTSPYSTSW